MDSRQFTLSLSISNFATSSWRGVAAAKFLKVELAKNPLDWPSGQKPFGVQEILKQQNVRAAAENYPRIIIS